MSHTPHALAAEFPEHVEAIHKLKLGNAHFARLAEQYHDVNRAIHRAESRVEPISEAEETALRKTRMALKDELYAMLNGGG